MTAFQIITGNSVGFPITKFYAHFMITADGTIKVLDKEKKKAMEGIRVMGETKNKWRM